MSTAAATVAVGRSRFRRFLTGYGQELVVVCSIILLFIVVGAVNARFLSDNNINSIFAGNAYIAVAAIGMSMVIISGHIDVSVGSLIGVIATIAGTLAVSGYPVWIAWLVPVLFAVAVNASVGALVAYTRIPSIVVTLGMLSILKGGLISATAGAWITDMPADFMIAQVRILGIPSPVYFMMILTVIAAFFMRYTDFGRAIYAVGGNIEAARAAGLSPERTVVGVFALHGFFAGVAGLLFATQLQVIQATVPPNLELTVITASVIGGV
ncbi:MAG TPA: ABC transporter permease, partial [Aestuariivirgaceae bacterium]|nr:ABC transporter permease [Aestuariivirgaceae bacterium]